MTQVDVLVDTSVWITHLRGREVGLTSLLDEARVLMHPFVHGELACGNLKSRASLLTYLASLPKADKAADDEILFLLEYHRIWGRGIGWPDANLLASALIANCQLWTLDLALKAACGIVGVNAYAAP